MHLENLSDVCHVRQGVIGESSFYPLSGGFASSEFFHSNVQLRVVCLLVDLGIGRVVERRAFLWVWSYSLQTHSLCYPLVSFEGLKRHIF